ncbi:ATP-binding protein [Chitinophaga arvensicola]|nr:ATP-binding protein [Chitinophaga arvensicola]
MDYSLYSTRTADPAAPQILKSLRAIGYSLEAAMADILDNSISAGAKSIWINYVWSGSETSVAFMDDGCGMNDAELLEAMRPGSKDPEDERASEDLGRFGLGLKTASFSQCKMFSVMSRRAEQQVVFLTWDLDFVCDHSRKWELLEYMPKGDWADELGKLESGTIVLWNDLDRLVGGVRKDDPKAQKLFEEVMIKAKRHLGLVYHRFLESRKVKIYFQGREIEPWNPFLPTHSATQSFPEELLDNGRVKLRGFVLPHQSKLARGDYERAEGINGWYAQQGFYVYRNERLLLGGSWLGLLRKQKLYTLSRIMLDLPNSMDGEWQIDIKKSIARLPVGYIDRIKAYAAAICSKSAEVYNHKGKIISRKNITEENFQPVWFEKQKHGHRFYEINRNHPVVLNSVQTNLSPLLHLLEETVPVNVLDFSAGQNVEDVSRPFEGEKLKELKKLLKEMYGVLIRTSTPGEVKSRLILIEPFNEYPELIASL